MKKRGEAWATAITASRTASSNCTITQMLNPINAITVCHLPTWGMPYLNRRVGNCEWSLMAHGCSFYRQMALDHSVSQTGIVSFGSAAGCETGYPDVYSRVRSYLKWISSETGIPLSTSTTPGPSSTTVASTTPISKPIILSKWLLILMTCLCYLLVL